MLLVKANLANSANPFSLSLSLNLSIYRDAICFVRVLDLRFSYQFDGTYSQADVDNVLL